MKRARAELTLDKLILKEAAEGNFYAPPDGGFAWPLFKRDSGSQNGGPGAWWGKCDRPNDIVGPFAMMKRRSRRPVFSSRGPMGGMGIG